MPERRVAVLHVTERRDNAPAYQRVANILNASAAATIDSLGWQARLHASGDASVDAALAVARDSDLVVILGGEDVHPDFYGGPRDYPGADHHREAADEAQIAVIQDAAVRGVPVLGICRGHQVINVAFGGGIVQHLEGTSLHRDPAQVAEGYFIRHTVDVGESILRGTMRPGEHVQSSHHQAVDRLGSGLRVAATSEDGVVEALVHDDLPILGVQWHPEHHGAPTDQLGRLLRRVDARFG